MSKSQSRPLRIGIDLMGSSLAPKNLLKALCSIPRQDDVQLCLVGEKELKTNSTLPFFEATDTIQMDESPISAIKQKKDSSMLVGLRLLKEKEIDAFISAGSTPALVLGAKTILSSVNGIKRPALFSYFPTKKDPVAVLDLGANVECKSHHYIQFAQMATSYLKVNGMEVPRIGLLNIGEESLKGTQELKRAYKELKELQSQHFQFLGNVEGKTVFDGTVDALVTDGFTGNVFLKTAEGVASLILDRLINDEAIQESLSDLQKHLHHAEYPGALLLGVNGIVIKSHGYSSEKAFVNAVHGAIALVKKDFLNSFKKQLKKVML